MELPGLAPLGSAAIMAAAAPLRKAPDVQKVDPGQKSNGTGTDARQHPQQDVTASQARDIAEIRREMERRDLPAGPPPTFELSLLEVESDLKQVMARIEAARTKDRDGDAIKAGTPAEPPRTEAVSSPVVTEAATTEGAPKSELFVAE